MSEKRNILLLASAATLALALQQGALAEPSAPPSPPPETEQPAQAQATPAATQTTDQASAPATEATTNAMEAAPSPVAPEPIVTAPADEPQPGQAANAQSPERTQAQPPATTAPPPPPPAMVEARERMEQRRAEMMQERKRRYEELRARAAEVGLELPETPPWDQQGLQPPMPAQPQIAMPEMPGGNRSTITQDERDARREQRYRMMREQSMQRGVEMPETPPWKLMNDEERKAHREKMRNMTPEERQAMRDQHWQEMRERARAQGIEMPETPPWKQAEQRRAEMKARWDSYRATLDAMTQEQKEAVQAIFGPGQTGFAPEAMSLQTPPGMPIQAPYGAQGSGFPPARGMPGFGYGRGQPMRPGPAQGWYGEDQGRYQGPPPPPADFNQRW